MKLTYLGTASIPTTTRNSHGILLELESYSVLLDCGEGIQRQLLMKPFQIDKIKQIFITHEHIDHIYGVVGVICLLGKRKQTIEILGSKLIIHEIESLVNKYAAPFKDYVNYTILEPEDTFKNGYAFDTFHTESSLGFVFECNNKKLVYPGDLTITSQSQLDALTKHYESADLAIIDGVHIQLEQVATLMKQAKLKKAHLIPIHFDFTELEIKGYGISHQVNFILPKDFEAYEIKEKIND